MGGSTGRSQQQRGLAGDQLLLEVLSRRPSLVGVPRAIVWGATAAALAGDGGADDALAMCRSILLDNSNNDEAKSGDEFALLIRDRRIAAFQNFTVCRAYVFSTRTVVPWRACLFLILVLCCFGFVRSKPANPEARAQDPRVVSPPKSNPLGGADFPSPFDEPSPCGDFTIYLLGV